MATATEQELLAARITFRAILPVIKVMLEENKKLGAKFEGVTACVQFLAKNDPEDVAAYLQFTDGALEVVQGMAEKPDLIFPFSNVKTMNAFFAGKPVLPPVNMSFFTNFGLLLKVFGVLLGLKVLMPNAKTKTPEMAKMKVKMTLYMMSTALSQMNKAGDEEMVEWTTKQPERIYQWSVEGEDVAAYLRIKAGKSKAGRGVYTRRKPFVHMKFRSVDDALPVLGNSIDMVKAIATGMIVLEGSPEYCAVLGTFMVKVGNMVS